jgi:hypothetical protein
MTSFKQILGLCGLASALSLASGCSDYTYFNVDVGLRISGDNRFTDDSTIDSIASCSIAVFMGDTQIEGSTAIRSNGVDACRLNKTATKDDGRREIKKPYPNDNNGNPTQTYDLGVLDYSSARDSGTLKFVVTMKNAEKMDMAQGWVEAKVGSGKIMSVDLIVDSCEIGKDKQGNAEFDCKIKDIK